MKEKSSVPACINKRRNRVKYFIIDATQFKKIMGKRPPFDETRVKSVINEKTSLARKNVLNVWQNKILHFQLNAMGEAN